MPTETNQNTAGCSGSSPDRKLTEHKDYRELALEERIERQRTVIHQLLNNVALLQEQIYQHLDRFNMHTHEAVTNRIMVPLQHHNLVAAGQQKQRNDSDFQYI